MHRAVLALGLAAIALSGCASPPVVHARDYRFDPDELDVAAGTAVKFLGDGPSDHTVTIHDAQGRTVFDHDLPKGGSLDYTFAAAGRFHVFCRLHEGMAVTVVAS